jgi:hypothetical protein
MDRNNCGASQKDQKKKASKQTRPIPTTVNRYALLYNLEETTEATQKQVWENEKGTKHRKECMSKKGKA